LKIYEIFLLFIEIPLPACCTSLAGTLPLISGEGTMMGSEVRNMYQDYFSPDHHYRIHWFIVAIVVFVPSHLNLIGLERHFRYNSLMC
jgi:hypothetical protein